MLKQSENIVEIEGVNKIYGTNHVVKDLNLAVEEDYLGNG